MELIGGKQKVLAGAVAIAMTLLILGGIAALSDHYAFRRAPRFEIAGKRPIPCNPAHRTGSPAHRVGVNMAVELSDQQHASNFKKTAQIPFVGNQEHGNVHG